MKTKFFDHNLHFQSNYQNKKRIVCFQIKTFIFNWNFLIKLSHETLKAQLSFVTIYFYWQACWKELWYHGYNFGHFVCYRRVLAWFLNDFIHSTHACQLKQREILIVDIEDCWLISNWNRNILPWPYMEIIQIWT